MSVSHGMMSCTVKAIQDTRGLPSVVTSCACGGSLCTSCACNGSLYKLCVRRFSLYKLLRLRLRIDGRGSKRLGQVGTYIEGEGGRIHRHSVVEHVHVDGHLALAAGLVCNPVPHTLTTAEE